MYTIHDCTDEDAYDVDLLGRFVILKPEYFKAEYRDKKYQLVKCCGGFGCDPSKMGNAIIVEEQCDNGDSYRIERYNRDILGIAKDSVVKEHRDTYITT